MPSFEDMFKKTIDEVLKNVFEDEVAKVILDCVGDGKESNLDEMVQSLAEALPKILGSGAVIIQDLIVESLYSQCGQPLEWKKEYKFRDYVMDLPHLCQRE